ncbi:tRNA acetyltransferase TAN1, partial [Lecanoromycetidae sp. Uapishka_2]
MSSARDLNDRKRKPDSDIAGSEAKKSKQWRTPRNGQHNYAAPTIEPGDAGIWATCEMGKEGKCTGELQDLFQEYAAKIYGTAAAEGDEPGDDEDAEADIEAEIKKELKGMKSMSTKKTELFQAVKIDIQCVLFFKTRVPIEPVSFVHAICRDALDGGVKRGRWIKKLTPMTMMGRATPEGLEKVAEEVLGPVFRADGVPERTFAIRPTRRNHNVMKRDDIIRQVAAAVGRRHRVDLKNYDYLILVDVYRNILGMSVVGSDFEELKQFNLAEIYDPTPRPDNETSNNDPTAKHHAVKAKVEAVLMGEKDTSQPEADEDKDSAPGKETKDDTPTNLPSGVAQRVLAD